MQQWSDETKTTLQEVYDLSPNTIVCLSEISTILSNIPEQEQIRVLALSIQTLAAQRQINARQICHALLRFHSPPSSPPFW